MLTLIKTHTSATKTEVYVLLNTNKVSERNSFNQYLAMINLNLYPQPVTKFCSFILTCF